MTTVAPLQLEIYNFSKLEVEANFSHKPDATVSIVNMRIQLGIGPVPELEKRYKIVLGLDELKVAETENGDGTLPYRIAIQVIGHFLMDPEEESPETREKILRISGGSLLYSAAREMVLLITGRGPWGPYQLPTVNFQTLKKVLPESGAEAKE
ncbi:MAG: hypothetical protein ACYCR3_10445 [Acidithiobacillus sp.]